MNNEYTVYAYSIYTCTVYSAVNKTTFCIRNASNSPSINSRELFESFIVAETLTKYLELVNANSGNC